MTDAFRWAVLMTDDGKPPNLTAIKNKEGKEIQTDDNIFHQL